MDNLSQFIGRFHPLFVHLPIGILVAAIVFEWMSRRPTFEHLRSSINMLYLFGGITAVFTCLTGYLLSTSGEYEGATLDYHMWLGILVALFSFLIYGMRTKGLYQKKWLTVSAPLFFLFIISWTGHLGGSLTHGESYLFDYMPQPFKSWIVGPEEEKIVIADVQEAMIYQEVVVPILKNNCYKCHSARKQKGKLRLDSPEFMAKGGKSGAVIVKAGAPEDSELIKRLLLPASDEEHMPPNKKDELSEAEVQLLQWWVSTGASFEEKVKNLPQPEAVKPLLAALENPVAEKEITSDFPEVDIQPASLEAINALNDIGAVVLPIGQNNNLLSVNFINVEKVGPNEMALLDPIKKHIAWLRMSESSMNDSLMQTLTEMPNLTKLYLDYTSVTDQGLEALIPLEHLKYLNLVGTAVTFQGLQKLKASRSLKDLFIFKTQTTTEEKKELMDVLPHVSVDTGGYYVPTLVSDTTVVTD